VTASAKQCRQATKAVSVKGIAAVVVLTPVRWSAGQQQVVWARVGHDEASNRHTAAGPGQWCLLQQLLQCWVMQLGISPALE
jgi:hypothetical protein